MSARDGGSDPRRKANLRLAWILLSAAAVFGLGFVARFWLFPH